MVVVAPTVKCRGGLTCAVAQAQLGCACQECEAGGGAVSMARRQHRHAREGVCVCVHVGVWCCTCKPVSTPTPTPVWSDGLCPSACLLVVIVAAVLSLIGIGMTQLGQQVVMRCGQGRACQYVHARHGQQPWHLQGRCRHCSVISAADCVDRYCRRGSEACGVLAPGHMPACQLCTLLWCYEHT